MKPTWQFASTQGGREDDVSNPLIETFEGDYNYYLAREILQNALDAHNPEIDEPVKVGFSLEEYRHSMFPGYDEFLNILYSAKDFWPEEKKKCHKFLDKAVECITQPTIPVLKISDYNTIGLNGDDSNRNSPWYGLVKSVGSTTKHGGEGGSFGLGKGAPFAASYLRTLCYSTKNDREQNVFQGVAELVSHRGTDDDVKRGSGSYGLPKQSSIRDRRLIDEHMVRKERGLDIFIMGYKIEEDWQEKLLKSVLRNFWPAIHDNELVVVIDDEKLSSVNLEEKLTKHFIDKPLKDSAKPEGNPLQYYKAFKNGKRFKENVEYLDEVNFYFNRTEEHLNKVAMIRKSKMVIYAKSFHFPAPYTGVFVCDNDKGNMELRQMESPEHNIWEPARYKEKGYVIEDEIREFIRGKLKSLTRIQEGGIQEIPGLHKYLPFDKEGEIKGSGGNGKEYTGEEGVDESGKEIGAVEEIDETVIVNPYKVAVINQPIKGHGDGGEVLRTGRKKRKKGKKAPGGGKGKADAILRENLRSRIFLNQSKKDELEYQMVLKSDLDGKCNLKLLAVGETVVEKVKILHASDLKENRYMCNGNRIMNVPLNKNKELKLKIRIKGDIKFSLKFEGYDLQQ